MVHARQCCHFCEYEAESYNSQEYFCGCGQRFCSIDCLLDHGDEAHTNGGITCWPVGTDSRLFDFDEIERTLGQERGDCSSDESNMDSSDSENDSESDDSEYEEDNNVYCECGNTVGFLVNGSFRTDPDCYRSECDQDGVRWCSDCWRLDREYQEECDENESHEEEITRFTEECCADMCCCTATFSNNKGSFCSDECLQRWSGCSHICSEENRNT